MAVKVAFIGSGGIANSHLNALKKVPDTQIVGLCDVDEAKLAAKQKEFGGDIFTDPDRMLATTKPDTVYICLPPFAHGAAEMACIKHKVPFIVEKPLTNDMALARKVAAGVKKAGIMAATAYMTRYRRSVARARELLLNDPPALAYGGWIGGFPGKHPWLFDKKLSGGQMLEQTTHTVDLLRYLCGEVVEVFSYKADPKFVKEAQGFKADCASTVAMQLKSGGVANIMNAWVCRAGGGVFLTLLSPNYKVEFSGWEQSVKITHAGGTHTEEVKGEQNIFEIEDAAWINAVKTGKADGVKSSYEDGVRSLAVSLAANESMDTGKAVKVKA
ncbi:MAG: hypothetical protein A3K19_25165 [Lentisphaerae bacterium RIFOXYB12_FULL_65_16]|nr:MAG: hypothetical protein A3K18_07290 [Lentisphaerae bacterium RIFOXYA12_64_32]OGV91112.1 MAG: hypothetical protein A3K19_25165 [Lentisphaerae bacterium RIFOXYB12_FULL_65_16]